MDLPKLSIVTPSFNQGAFIEHTICSVLDQNYPHLEYFIIDGGSTDDSVAIIKRYEKYLAGWVSEADDGQSQAINKGLRQTRGDLVAYINSDDFYQPMAFAQIADCYMNLPHSIRNAGTWLAGACNFLSEQGEEVEIWSPKMPPSNREHWITGPWGVPQVATFWDRRLFSLCGLFREDLNYIFDTEFGLRLLFNGYVPVLFDDVLATRVLQSDSKSMLYADRFRKEEQRLLSFFENYLTSEEYQTICYQQRKSDLRPQQTSFLKVLAVLSLLQHYPRQGMADFFQSIARLRRKIIRGVSA